MKGLRLKGPKEVLNTYNYGIFKKLIEIWIRKKAKREDAAIAACLGEMDRLIAELEQGCPPNAENMAKRIR